MTLNLLVPNVYTVTLAHYNLAQQRLEQLLNAVKQSAEITLGLEPPSHQKGVNFCPCMQLLSKKQRNLCIRITNSDDNQVCSELKTERNKIMRNMRKLGQENALAALDDQVKEFERLHDGARMFRAVQLLC